MILTFRRPALLAIALLSIISQNTMAQYPTSCASVGSRANSNGQANSCPNNGGTMASNFLSTSYATVPSSSKTGNLTLTYSGSQTSLTPYAITNVWLTNSGTTLTAVQFGPASPPTVSGGNTQVSYCFYGANLATVGTLSFQLTNPQTGAVYGICSYDASCNSNCAVVSNPITLPVDFSYFKVQASTANAVQLAWATAQEQNNKGFEVQRSSGDGNFLPIAFVASLRTGGNSTAVTEYSFTDDHLPSAQKLTYRLDQVDLDGRHTYSPIVVANASVTPPHPEVIGAHDHIDVSIPASAVPTSYDMLICDTQGRTLQRHHFATAGSYTIPGLASEHLYYISVISSADGSRQVKTIYLH